MAPKKNKTKQPECLLGPYPAAFHRPSNEPGGGWIRVPRGGVKVLKYKKGNKNGSDMYVVTFHIWHGVDCFNCPIPFGLPFAREETRFYFKSNSVTNGGYKARNIIAIDFEKAKDTDKFEAFFEKVTGMESCLDSKLAAQPNDSKPTAQPNDSKPTAQSKISAPQPTRKSTRIAANSSRSKSSNNHVPPTDAQYAVEVAIEELNEEAARYGKERSMLQKKAEYLLQKTDQVDRAREQLLKNKRDILRLEAKNLDLQLIIQANFMFELFTEKTNDKSNKSNLDDILDRKTGRHLIPDEFFDELMKNTAWRDCRAKPPPEVLDLCDSDDSSQGQSYSPSKGTLDPMDEPLPDDFCSTGTIEDHLPSDDEDGSDSNDGVYKRYEGSPIEYSQNIAKAFSFKSDDEDE